MLLYHQPNHIILFDILILSTIPSVPIFEQIHLSSQRLNLVHAVTECLTKHQAQVEMYPLPKSVCNVSQQRKNNRQSIQKEDPQKSSTTPAPGSGPASEALKPGQTKLREWIADTKKAIVCPGVYDGLTARIAIAQGFKCLHLRSAAISLARSGLLVSGESSLEFVMDLTQTIQQIDRDVPLIGEADGSLDVEAIKKVLTRFHHAGIAAVLLDDCISGQCSKRNRKENAINEDTFLEHIQAAANERLRIGSDIVIVARTNILLPCGCQYCWDQATTRLERAIRKGADVVFMAGTKNLKEIEHLACQAFTGVPLMTNPWHRASIRKVKNLGVKIVSYPELFTSAIHDSVAYTVQDFRETGEVRPVPETSRLDDATGLGGLRALCEL